MKAGVLCTNIYYPIIVIYYNFDHPIATCDNATLQCMYDVRAGAGFRPDRPCTEEAKQIK